MVAWEECSGNPEQRHAVLGCVCVYAQTEDKDLQKQ